MAMVPSRPRRSIRVCHGASRSCVLAIAMVMTVFVLSSPAPYIAFFPDFARRDPGRRELRGEYSGPGEQRLSLPLSCGGRLLVQAYKASEQQVPAGWPVGSFQEWRSLVFESAPETAQERGPPFIQSVSKVTCAADNKWLPEADPEVLALNYPKTLAASVAASLRMLAAREPRVLVIGLGSGSVPLWLANAFPDSRVDVVELEAAVIQAAGEALGFPIEAGGGTGRSPLRRALGGRLQAICGDGAALAAGWAADPHGPRYDAVIIDAYDALNRVPRPLWDKDGPLAQALPVLLKERAVVAANVPPGFPTEEMLRGFQKRLQSNGKVVPAALALEVPETANTVALTLRCSSCRSAAEFYGRLCQAAENFQQSGICLFSAPDRLTKCLVREV
ncbi:unnamed protein product [Symbiodinium pilosum]|uniref:Uncharacterized protein n=1 Tax=Symbiodinium pilosum TaxID=2952 RepID=A0A812QP33_SYMPI|nr:unnamed protein product [Symbiodinium pilosum]